MNLEFLVHSYGYLTILLGTFLEGETVLILGGLTAQQGHLEIWYVILAAFIGGVVGDQVYFFIGRRYGRAALAKNAAWQARTEQVHRMLKRHRSWMILGLRFMYGLRTVASFALGTSCVSTRRFMFLHIVGAAVWAVVIGTGGYISGRLLFRLFEQIKEHQLSVLAIVVATIVTAWAIRRMWRCGRT